MTPEPGSLFPRPRRVERSGSVAPADAAVVVVADPSLPAEGYRLRIDGTIEVRHADGAGLRYGLDTLDQLRDSSLGPELPGLVVDDHPDQPVRGFMLDISRDRVPTMDTLAWLVDVLAACRYNQLQLYTEHTFAYRDHEPVWRDASPLTAEEMGRLDGWCADRGIELVANQNCFGHMERWLRHPAYRQRAECPDGWRFPGLGTPMPPSTLAPTPDNARFALGLVRELAATVASRRVHIGCDETFELGRCASRALVEEQGRAAVFAEHLGRLLGPLLAEGFEVLFWADMLHREPELLAGLPSGESVAVVWNYEAPSAPGSGVAGLFGGLDELADALGLPADAHRGFAAYTRAVVEAGQPFWVAPGTSTWNSLIGRWSNARANLADAAQVAAEAGAGGLVVCDWGDTGHLQPLSVSLPPIVLGGALAWGRDRHDDLDVAAVVDRLLGDPAGRVGQLLLELGDLYLGTGRRSVNGSPLFYDLLVAPPLPVWGDADPDGVAATRDVLEQAMDTLAGTRLEGTQGEEIRAELLAAVGLARHGTARIARLAGGSVATASDLELAADLTEAMDRQRAAWLARSRPGGLADSLARLEPTLAAYG